MEWLANLSLKWVLIVAGLLLLLRGALLRARGSHALCAPACEFLEAALAALVVVFLVVRPYLLQAYFIPSPSMRPTLMEADRILVNKLVYHLGRPRRQEVIVFHPPEDQVRADQDYIKRVIGLPGETVEVVPARLLVDGRTLMRLTRDPASEILSESFQPQERIGFTFPLGGGGAQVRGTEATVSGTGREDLKVALYRRGDRIRSDSHFVYLNERPMLAGVFAPVRSSRDLAQWGGDADLVGTVYTTGGDPRLVLVRGSRLELDPGHVLVDGRRLDEPYLMEPPAYAMAPTRVPLGRLFVLGDNRNQSQDSHFWGPLPLDHVVGRADVVFWPPRRAGRLGAPR